MPTGSHIPPAKLRIKLANEHEDILAKSNLSQARMEFKYHFLHANRMSELWLNRVMKLLEINMRTLYENCQCGWNTQEKKDEIIHPTTRLVLVTASNASTENILKTEPDPEETLVGFLSYRFEVGSNKSECALYVYELQIEENYQRRGLGKELMRIARSIAISFRMDKMMLTAFQSNESAIKFYKKLHFGIDKSCPAKNEADYLIMSQKIKF